MSSAPPIWFSGAPVGRHTRWWVHWHPVVLVSRRRDDTAVAERLTALAGHKRRYGYRRLHVLLRQEGRLINRKRTYCVYHAAGLMVRRRKRKRIVGVEKLDKVVLQRPTKAGRWTLCPMALSMKCGGGTSMPWMILRKNVWQ